jgi:putative heme degradation protein
VGRVEFGPRDGESPEVFHARLFEKAEQLMAERPERRARDGAARLVFTDGAFGTVPGAGEVAARAGEWTTRLRGQLDRVAAEVTDLKEGTRTAKELAIDVDGATRAIARRGATH